MHLDVASVVDLGELRAVHGLRDLVGARAAPAAAVVPAVAASPPAVAAVAAARVAAPAPPAASRVAATAGVATPTAPAAAGVAAATVVLHVSFVLVVLPRLCMIQSIRSSTLRTHIYSASYSKYIPSYFDSSACFVLLES